MNRRFSRTILNTVIAIFMVVVSGVQASDDRMETLGQAMICMCGCNQLLSECNMINCPTSQPMRDELKGHIDAGEGNDTILASFREKYGPRVLSAPPTSDWFNLSAWVMPFVVLFGGAAFVIGFLRHLRTAAPVETPQPPVDAAKYEAEIEEELRKLTPED